ncbi:MAG: hypothetical protein JNK82_37710 [Myxococcaceae bacterium]|nr:hypothetical protein [Myxococcaceae bacterium]
MVTGVLGLVALLVCGQQFNEDFEQGLGAWQVIDRTGITVRASAAAAHRGDAGLRIVDTETVFEDGTAGAVQKNFTESSRTFYTRLWFRLVDRSDPGGGSVFWSALWERRAGLWSAAHSCQFDYRSQVMCSDQDVDNAGNVDLTTIDAGVNVRDGRWRLYEGATLGRGTDAGAAVYAIDGVEVLRRTALHANTTHFPSLQVGEVYSYDPGLTCVLDFDDVRFGPTPQPTRFAVAAVEPLFAGECTGLEVTLTSSLPAPDGGVATRLSAPYALKLEVNGEVFADSECTTPATTPVLSGEALALWVKPAAAGALDVTVRHAEGDLLPGSAALDVGEALPASEGQRGYYSLRCATAPGSLVLLALALRRRRRR